MKAEHRKELKTNELADWLGRTYENVRAGNRSTAIGAGIVVLVAALIAVYVYFLSAPSQSSTLFAKLNDARDIKDLELIAEKNPGTIPARTARFEMARILYDEGIRDLPAQAADIQAGAVVKLIKARGLYEQLAGESKDNPLLVQEAMMWTARAEEALIGAPDPDQPGQPAGSIDRAIQYYETLANANPETFQTKAAGQRAKVLQERERRAQIEDFYSKLYDQGGKLKK